MFVPFGFRQILPTSNPICSQTVKGTLPQSAQTSHTQLAHALVQYLGVEVPTDLEKYGIRTAGDLVDLISKVNYSKCNNLPLKPITYV